MLPALTLTAKPVTVVTHLAHSDVLRILARSCVGATGTGNLSPIGVIFGRTLEGTLLPIMAMLKSLTTDVLANAFIVRGVFTVPKVKGCFMRDVGAHSCPIVVKAAIFCDSVLVVVLFLISVTCKVLSPEVGLRGGRTDW